MFQPNDVRFHMLAMYYCQHLLLMSAVQPWEFLCLNNVFKLGLDLVTLLETSALLSISERSKYRSDI